MPRPPTESLVPLPSLQRDAVTRCYTTWPLSSYDSFRQRESCLRNTCVYILQDREILQASITEIYTTSLYSALLIQCIVQVAFREGGWCFIYYSSLTRSRESTAESKREREKWPPVHKVDTFLICTS